MSTHAARPLVARVIRLLSIPIILGWLAIMVVTNTVVPQLEIVGKQHSVSLSPQEAPAMIAMKKLGANFQQFDSDSMAMIVLEGDQPLGVEARRYYDDLVSKLEADTKHVQHVHNFWGDLITAAGSQSTDAKAAYVQVNLAGDQGATLGIESVEAIGKIVDESHPPAGVKAYVTGQAPLTTDITEAGVKSMVKITFVTIAVIAVTLLIVYRSITTTLLVLGVVLIEMSAARGRVAALGNMGVLGLSTFSTNLLTSLAIAAGTDYAIFLIGRYQEARQAGQELEDAYYTAFHGVGHVILGVRPHRRGRDVVPALHPVELLQLAGYTQCDRHVGRGDGVVDPGACGAGGWQSLRVVRLQAGAQVPRLAAGRDGRSPLACPDSRCGHLHCADRSAGVARLQDELQRTALHSGRSAVERRVRRGRAAFQRRQNESRHPARGRRPRSAQRR